MSSIFWWTLLTSTILQDLIDSIPCKTLSFMADMFIMIMILKMLKFVTLHVSFSGNFCRGATKRRWVPQLKLELC